MKGFNITVDGQSVARVVTNNVFDQLVVTSDADSTEDFADYLHDAVVDFFGTGRDVTVTSEDI